MNSAMLAMLPAVNHQTLSTTQTSTSSSTGKFGAVLESALSTGRIAEEFELEQEILSADQIAIIEDVLQFLGISSLEELEDGNGVTKELLLNESFTEQEDDIAYELYVALKPLEALDAKDWEELDLNGMANVLKLAKLQDLLTSQQNIQEEQATIQKEIKNLLEVIAGKLQKWLNADYPEVAIETSFSPPLENGRNKSLEVVKQAYARVVTSDSSEEKVSNGLTLRIAESNTQGSPLPFQMTKLEQFVLNTSKNGQAADAEQFVKSFENILSKVNFSKVNGVQKLLIRLNPEHLGSLRIELIQKEGTMVAKILATTAQAKEMLDRQVQGLKQAFTNQSIQLEKIEISQQISMFNSERFAQRDNDANEQRQQQAQQNESKDDSETDFTESFAEALLNIEV